ncbi:MAG: transposase, partial [Phycisphaerae bacterium]|nr:transposase [Phycisphaerae bacterium]
ARTKVEFGAKVSISLVDGFCHCDTINFDSYNESTELIDQIKSYKDRQGCYPESVHADQIYRTSKNRKFCKENDIRLSGPALGRPSADKEKRKAIRQQQYQDEVGRIPVEGKFGQGKRRFSLGLIMSKLAETSVSTISLTFIVMNLEKILAAISFFAYYLWLSLRQQPKTAHNYHPNLTNMPCQYNENHTNKYFLNHLLYYPFRVQWNGWGL